ncbi:MAG: hypothetical protein M1569_02230 [Candidatus Marsarchaeota archaeon]|nr:hypothetical protein [Candidatus Marsarchaeota archaeon]MCL5413199.1 hypothetical protein [Candidatus Marsarchaeota archaeon]
MEFSIPNIYVNRNLKVFVAIPVVLMLISIFLARNITLDSSLSGGVALILQTNSTMSASHIASMVVQQLHVSSPSVQTSSGEVQITIAANKSLSDAEDYLMAAYAYNANYTNYVLNATGYRIALKNNPSNQTLAALSAAAQKGENSSLVGIKNNLNSELDSLYPFIGNVSRNYTSAQVMITQAQDTYSNASASYKNRIVSKISDIIPFSSYSFQQVTVLQSSFFLQQLQTIIIVAFILISIVVFVIFRSIVPSFAVVFGAANDIIVALGAMALFGIPLGIASIGGLLMLLGYSIDTDVLTAIRIIKRHEGTPEERAYSSMKTGMTMTITAIVSFAVLFAISLIAYVPTYYEISGVVLFGLIGDLATTWLGNASIILMYVRRKEGR